MKGFIEVTSEYSNDKVLVHYTQIKFVKTTKSYLAMLDGKWLKESYEELKQLIEKAQS